MSLVDVRKFFSYIMYTSSLDYIRNYNFNSSTVSTLPLLMTNTSREIPLTVNLSSSRSWIDIVDPVTGYDRKYPNGNVVLGPTSSSLVYIKVDLPPEIENLPEEESRIDTFINLNIKSGSFPVIGQDDGPGSNASNRILVEKDTYIIRVNETVPVNFTLYAEDGTVEQFAIVTLRSNNMSVVQEVYPTTFEVAYSPKYIKGISPGETTITITANATRTAVIKVQTIDSGTP